VWARGVGGRTPQGGGESGRRGIKNESDLHLSSNARRAGASGGGKELSQMEGYLSFQLTLGILEQFRFYKCGATWCAAACSGNLKNKTSQ